MFTICDSVIYYSYRDLVCFYVCMHVCVQKKLPGAWVGGKWWWWGKRAGFLCLGYPTKKKKNIDCANFLNNTTGKYYVYCCYVFFSVGPAAEAVVSRWKLESVCSSRRQTNEPTQQQREVIARADVKIESSRRTWNNKITHTQVEEVLRNLIALWQKKMLVVAARIT